MKNNRFTYIIILLLVAGFSSCEDPIEVDIREDRKELVVDAVITNQPGPQTIKLSQTIGYFAPRGSNPPVTGATVVVFDADTLPYFFTESLTEPGSYIYPNGSDFNRIGDQYGLTIISGADTFLSISTMNPVPDFDTLQWTFEEGNSFIEDRYEVEFKANDLPGIGNTYLFRSFKNDTMLNIGESVNIAYDAAFSPGADYDGIEFIVPIRRVGMNDFDNPFQLGDKFEAEVIGITNEFYLFLNLAEQQINNGGLFATPPANVPNNIVNIKGGNSARANGFFVIGESKKRSAIIQ
jgi:hypothetical protein